MSVFQFGMKHWKKYIPLSILAKLCSFIAILCDLALPLISAGIIDYVIAYDPSAPTSNSILQFLFAGALGEPSSWRLFFNLALVFAGVFLCRLIFLYIKNVTFQWCGLRMECDMRAETYAKLLKLDSETLSRYNMGELLTTMNRDTIIFKEMFSRMFMNIFDSACMIIITVALLISFDYRLIFLPVLLSPFFIFLLLRLFKEAHKLFKEIRAGNSVLNLAVQENIDAVRIVRAFTGEESELKKFDEKNNLVRDLGKREAAYSAKFECVTASFEQIAYVGTVIFAVLLVLNGNIALGALSAATTYVTKIISHIRQISRSFFMMQNQLVAGGRLQHFLSEEGAVPDYPSARCAVSEPHIELKNVGLVMGEKQVLKNICLDVPYGKKIGIMGGTGSGKSALLKILSRIFDIDSGELLINGTPVKEFPLEVVRTEFSYVFQDVFLFSNTVDANIAFSKPDCEAAEVAAAAVTAQAAAFVEKLDEGYDTVIGERGMGLSGGQKQRISIARALIKGAPVLILDDASSALDMATEKRVLASIKKSCPEHTLLIATHRVSSVLDCDEIIYLRDGEIIERGTADELIALDGAFAAIYKLQTSDGQLDDSSYGKEEL